MSLAPSSHRTDWNPRTSLSGVMTGHRIASAIASALEIKGVSAYVRVSELKKQAVEKLIENVDHSQVLDYL